MKYNKEKFEKSIGIIPSDSFECKLDKCIANIDRILTESREENLKEKNPFVWVFKQAMDDLWWWKEKKIFKLRCLLQDKKDRKLILSLKDEK